MKKMTQVRKILRSLIEIILEDGVLSIGRTLLLITFTLAVINWVNCKEIPESHLTILISLLGYVIGSKFIDNAKASIEKISDIKNTITKKDNN